MTTESCVRVVGLAQNSLVTILMWLAAFTSLQAAQNTNLKEFHQRVQKYVQLQRQINKGQPKISKQTEPAEIAAHRETMAAAIQAARPHARQGDIFFAGIRPYFVRLIHYELKGPKGAPARQTIKVGNPQVVGSSEKVTLQVNAVYPDGAPLSAVPPNLLRQLPVLPPELDYRFVGRHLILRDVDANLIVDYILEAAPLS